MKKIIIAAMLLATSAFAEKPATLSCYFQSGENFTVVGSGGTSMIQWGDHGFRSAATTYEDPWLTVVEVSDSGNMFKMAFNVRTKAAFGETQFTDGHKKGGPLWCAFK